MGRKSREKRDRREDAMRHTLDRLKAGKKLAMIERDGEVWIHIPEEVRHSTAATLVYLLACLPDAPTAGDD